MAPWPSTHGTRYLLVQVVMHLLGDDHLLDFLQQILGLGQVQPERVDAHVVLPTIDEVILVQKAFMEAEPEIGEVHTARVDEAFGAMLASVNDEAMQMFVAPAEGDLQRSVRVSNGAVATNEQASPDQRADAVQDNAQLVHDGLGGCVRFRHAVIVHFPGPSCLPRFVPLSIAEWSGVPLADYEGAIISETLGDKRALLRADHGQIVVSSSIQEAATLALCIEQVAKLQLLPLAAGQILPTSDELAPGCLR